MQRRRTYWLSKSSFLMYLQCPKSFYLYKYNYHLQDKPSPELLAKYAHGHQFETIRDKLYPGGILLKPPSPTQWAKAVETTTALVASEQPVLYEAAFAHNGAMCAVDVLKKDSTGWQMIEIKSSTRNAAAFWYDAAYQYWVLTNSGLALTDVILVQPTHELSVGSEIKTNYTFISLLEKACDLFDEIDAHINNAKNILLLPQQPDIQLGKQCEKPYSCKFLGYCRHRK